MHKNNLERVLRRKLFSQVPDSKLVRQAVDYFTQSLLLLGAFVRTTDRLQTRIKSKEVLLNRLEDIYQIADQMRKALYGKRGLMDRLFDQLKWSEEDHQQIKRLKIKYQAPLIFRGLDEKLQACGVKRKVWNQANVHANIWDIYNDAKQALKYSTVLELKKIPLSLFNLILWEINFSCQYHILPNHIRNLDAKHKGLLSGIRFLRGRA